MTHAMTSIESPSLANALSSGIKDLHMAMSAEQQYQLLVYVALLAKWNQVYNLTAVREPSRMIGLHILDSLSLLPHLGAAKSILDVGSGGGLPGICLAIASPMLEVVMLDSIKKKTTFIRQAIGELALANASVECERVEAYRPQRRFELITSRAFAELGDFVRGAAHLLAPGGKMLAMKGLYPHDEIARLPATFRVASVAELHVPQVDGKRHLVILEKVEKAHA